MATDVHDESRNRVHEMNTANVVGSKSGLLFESNGAWSTFTNL